MAATTPRNSRTWQEHSTPGAAVSRQLHLIRHGQSVWNVSKRLQGQAHSPQLTRLGINQVRRTAHTLAAQYCAQDHAQPQGLQIVTSDLMRAQQSAHILAATLTPALASHTTGPTGNQTATLANHSRPLNVRIDTRLREQCVGDMEGKTPSELTAEEPPPGEHIADIRWAAGESLRDVAERLQPLVDQLTYDFQINPSHGDVVIVSHGITLAVLRALLDGKTHYEIDWSAWPNAACRSWTLAP